MRKEDLRLEEDKRPSVKPRAKYKRKDPRMKLGSKAVVQSGLVV